MPAFAGMICEPWAVQAADGRAAVGYHRASRCSRCEQRPL